MTKCTVTRTNKPHDVYIGRGSVWGNPYKVGVDGTRTEVIRMFEEHLISSPFLMKRLVELKGKRLGCYCKPKACHGDVIAKHVNKLSNPFYSRKSI